MNSIENVCRDHSLDVIEIFTAGHICPSVYKSQNCDGEIRVIKIGNDIATIREVEKNLEGYEMLKKIGLGYVCPNLYFAEVKPGSAVIIMEYCGKDFFSTIETAQNPKAMFQELIIQLEDIYKKSVRVESPASNVREVMTKIIEQYNNHLVTVFDQGGRLRSTFEILSSRINFESFKSSCFSSWDFTPRNVFLTQQGLKYIDCNANILGIPIIDLACFAGVVRDVHALPGSVDGYNLLMKFATERVAEILDIDQLQAMRLFYLGRTLQLFLGARLRIKTDPILAKKLYEEAVGFLEKITV